MPAQVHLLAEQHVEDDLDHGFKFSGFGVGDNIASFSVIAPPGIVQSVPASSSGQTVTVRLKGSAGMYRIIVDATAQSGQDARIEADILIVDPP